jgi:hypothetical protein
MQLTPRRRRRPLSTRSDGRSGRILDCVFKITAADNKISC